MDKGIWNIWNLITFRSLCIAVPHLHNVWASRPNAAPFDQHYYLILNLAVGGTTGYFEDGGNKPWSNDSPNSVATFWDARDSWLPSWDYKSVDGRKDPQSAMAIDYVRVWSDDAIFPGAPVAPGPTSPPTPQPPTNPPTPSPPTTPPTTLPPTTAPPTTPPTTAPPTTAPPTIVGCPVPGSGFNNNCCLDCPSNRACVADGGCYSDANADLCPGGACPAYIEDPTNSAACSANPGCASLGLSGNCCPTPEGVRLGCC
jgi:hypothetical protein